MHVCVCLSVCLSVSVLASFCWLVYCCSRWQSMRTAEFQGAVFKHHWSHKFDFFFPFSFFSNLDFAWDPPPAQKHMHNSHTAPSPRCFIFSCPHCTASFVILCTFCLLWWKESAAHCSAGPGFIMTLCYIWIRGHMESWEVDDGTYIMYFSSGANGHCWAILCHGPCRMLSVSHLKMCCLLAEGTTNTQKTYIFTYTTSVCAK